MPEVEHPLMTVSGVTPDTIKLDLLHLVDLGIAAHLYGNLIWDLLEIIQVAAAGKASWLW